MDGCLYLKLSSSAEIIPNETGGCQEIGSFHGLLEVHLDFVQEFKRR